MADPAGIIGIIGVVGQVIQWSVQIGLDWKDAPTEAKGFVSELQSLKTVLSETNTNVLINPDFADAFHGRHSALFSELDPLHNKPTQSMLSSCRRELEKLLEELKKRAQGHKIGWERLKGAFMASSTREAVQKLSRRCARLNSLLQIDMAALAASTHREVTEGRREQQQQHQTQYRILDHVRQTVDDQKLRQEEVAVLNWLTPVDYHTTQHNDITRGRQPGTGEWLLKSDEFETWVSGKAPTLFCPGMPGAGKTMMASIVIDYLRSRFRGHPGVGVAFLYCNFRRQVEQTPEELLSNLLKQLARGFSPCLKVVQALRDKHIAERTTPSLSELAQTLQSVLSSYTERVFVVLDALDEWKNHDGNRTKLLTALFETQTTSESKLVLLATSRPIPDIMGLFQGVPLLEIRASGEDIERYLRGRMGELKSFVARRPDLQDEVVFGIAEAVDGMFLLAQLYMNSLVDKTTPRALRDAIHRLQLRGAKSADDRRLELLGQAYEGAMVRINGQMPGDRDLAIQVLSWLTCARLPLGTVELQHALATEGDDQELDHQNLPEVEDLISVCAGLVTFDQNNSRIRLVHYTTQEYFEQTQGRWLPDAHLNIAETCLTYLSFRTFESGFCSTGDELITRLELYPLYQYAACYWGYHAHDTACDSEKLIGFLEKDAQVEAAGNAELDGRGSDTPLHLAVGNRQVDVVHVLLAANQMHVNEKNPDGWTPLGLAANMGHEALVKTLLATGRADVNSVAAEGQTPLMLAARGKTGGRVAVIRALLATEGIEVNARDPDGFTALAVACVEGHHDVVEVLLTAPLLDTNLEVYNVRATPLQWAIKHGRYQTMKILLATGSVDVEKRDAWGSTALLTASQNGNWEAVQILLAAGQVDVNKADDFGRIPLRFAVEHGRLEVVQALLETGKLDVNAIGSDGLTPLDHAREKGHTAIAALLLANGAREQQPL